MKDKLIAMLLFVCCVLLIVGGCTGDSNDKPIAAPKNTSVIAGVNTLTVSWDTVVGATSYNIYYSTNANVSALGGVKISNATSPFTILNLDSDTTYYVVVTTVIGNRESVVSLENTGKTHRISACFGSSMSDYGVDVLADKFGNLYAVGDTLGGFDGNMQTGTSDVFIIKYDIGGSKKWSRQIGAVGSVSNSTKIAIDRFNKLYVVGTTQGNFDGNLRTGLTDMFLAKYDSRGNKIWTRQLGAKFYGVIEQPSIVVDTNGFIYISGTTNSSFDGKPIKGMKDIFLTKFDNEGNILWLNTFGVPGQYTTIANSAIDNSGNIILAGASCGGFDGVLSTGICDLLMLKFDFNGNKIWAQMVGAAGAYTQAQSVAVDTAGNSFVTGRTGGNYDGIVKPAWGDNMFLTKFNHDGRKEWSRLLSGGFFAYGNSVAVDESSNVYVAGNTGNPIDGNIAIGPCDMFIVKYDATGDKKWSKQFGVNYSSTSANGITTDGVGGHNIFVVGSANGDVFTHVATSSYYDFNFFIIGISSDSGSY